MDQGRWQQIEQLYHAALAQPAPDRARYLGEACAGDEALRRDVESLLQSPATADGVFAGPAMAAATPPASATSTLTGRRLGVYQLQERIGAGGMGEVYRARDTKLGRDVAIKILPRTFTDDPERLARFAREARVLATLNHPNIATIHGTEESDGIRALVMELIGGETLAERIVRGPLRVADALAIARQLADALDTAHEKGIVHRDLKPANIKITPSGTVKVLDFGLAKVAPENDAASQAPTVTVDRTREGVIAGTAAYMSPEQARGLPVDKRTDIWAFGCVLYEMLTGRPSFAGQTISDTIAAILEREPGWAALPHSAPPHVVRLLRRCLTKDVSRRIRDIGDARIEIEEALRGQAEAPLPAAKDGALRPRNLIAASLLVLVVAGTVAIVMNARKQPAAVPNWSPTQAIVTQLTNHGGTEVAGALAPDGRSFVFVSEHGGTTDIWVRQVSGGEPVRLTDDDAEEGDLVYAPDGDSVYFTRTDGADRGIWRIGALGGAPLRVVADARMPAPSLDGERLAYYATDGETGRVALMVHALDGSNTRTLKAAVGPVPRPPKWSPDGRWLSYVTGGALDVKNLLIVDVATGEERQATRFAGAGEGITSLAWLPDNRHLAVSYVPPAASTEEDLGIVNAEDGTLTRLTFNVAQAFRNVNVSADGSRLVATSFRHPHELWRVPLGGGPDENGQQATRLLGETHDPSFGFVPRDGRMVLFNGGATGGRNLWAMPLDGSTSPRQITSIPGNAVQHPALSPDGARVAFGSRASGAHDIWIQNLDGSGLRQLTNDAAPDYWPVWSPDGRWIVFTTVREGRQATWRVPAAGGPPDEVVEGFFRGDWIRAPSGDGTWLVSSGVGRGTRLVDVERRKVVWENRLGGPANMPMFSPDGRSISVAAPESRLRSVIWILDSATGQERLGVRLPERFDVEFRANWVDDGKALLFTRHQDISHIVLFDRFWLDGRSTPAR
jgi:Tol biopolymer transport system component